MTRFIRTLVNDDSGQDLIEYGLLAGLVSLACVTMVINVGTGVEGVYSDLEQQADVLTD